MSQSKSHCGLLPSSLQSGNSYARPIAKKFVEKLGFDGNRMMNGAAKRRESFGDRFRWGLLVLYTVVRQDVKEGDREERGKVFSMVEVSK